MDLTLAELKNNIHRLIVESDDLKVLEKVQEYFVKLKGNQTDWLNSLSTNEAASVEKGLSQLNNGHRIPHDEVRQKVKLLLGKK